MIGVQAKTRIFIGLDPVDMRKSFDGLGGEVRRQLGLDPLSGDVFVFVNVSRTLLKALVFDRSGDWIWYRRLERGTFQLPRPTEHPWRVELDMADLSLILEGIDLASAKRRLRYRRPSARLSAK
jgi:transposase